MKQYTTEEQTVKLEAVGFPLAKDHLEGNYVVAAYSIQDLLELLPPILNFGGSYGESKLSIMYHPDIKEWVCGYISIEKNDWVTFSENPTWNCGGGKEFIDALYNLLMILGENGYL